MQIQHYGLTGTVKFDKHGTRTGFTLDVLEVSLGRGLAKVGCSSVLKNIWIRLQNFVKRLITVS